MISKILELGVIFFSVFLGAFFWARSIQFYSLVDAVWAWSIGMGLLYLGVESLASGLSHIPTLLAILCLWSLWSVRLGWHLSRRLRDHFPEEDPRYSQLKEIWAPKKFFGFFMAQGFLGWLLVGGVGLPFFFADQQIQKGQITAIGILTAIGFLSVFGVSVSDYQLSRFKKKLRSGEIKNKRVCDEGLWKYSRHPNYFFEILFWISGSLVSLVWVWSGPISLKLMALVPGILMAFLIFKVTGVPYAEQSSLRSRGEEFKSYQQRTSVLIPWPPKKKHLLG